MCSSYNTLKISSTIFLQGTPSSFPECSPFCIGNARPANDDSPAFIIVIPRWIYWFTSTYHTTFPAKPPVQKIFIMLRPPYLLCLKKHPYLVIIYQYFSPVNNRETKHFETRNNLVKICYRIFLKKEGKRYDEYIFFRYKNIRS